MPLMMSPLEDCCRGQAEVRWQVPSSNRKLLGATCTQQWMTRMKKERVKANPTTLCEKHLDTEQNS